MTSRRNVLAVIREQQLANLNAKLGRPVSRTERVVVPFACAIKDQYFTATFSRTPPERVYNCERTNLPESRGFLARLLTPKEAARQPPPVDVAVEDIDFGGVRCACGVAHGWVRCSRCHAHVCKGRSEGSYFRCRQSCGSQGQTRPLRSIEVVQDRTGLASSKAALGHSALNALPRRDSR